MSELIHTPLERDLVGIEPRLVAVRRLHADLRSRTAHAALAIAPRVEHAEVVGDDLDRKALFAIAIGPRARLQATLNEHEPALLDELLRRLGETLPAHDAEPLRLLTTLARRAVVEDAVHRDGELGDGLAVRGHPELRIASDVADDHDLVERSHSYSSLRTTRWRRMSSVSRIVRSNSRDCSGGSENSTTP